jgi:hypothetical protein
MCSGGRRFHGPAGVRRDVGTGGWFQAGCRAWMRVQAVARSAAQAQPGGIFRMRLRAGVTRRAGRMSGEEPEPQHLRFGFGQLPVQGDQA